VTGTVNEVSCETLNKFEGEEEMKKMLIGGLVVCLMMGLFVGCPEKPEEEKDDGTETVAAEYQGRYNVTDKNFTHVHYILTKNKFDQYGADFLTYSFAARTDGKNLHIMAHVTDKGSWLLSGTLEEHKIGYFEDNKLILTNYMDVNLTDSKTITAVKQE
jgi:hypothetical protein